MLQPQQKEVFDKIIANIEYILNPATLEVGWKNKVISLSGAAGTGKTHLLAEIVKYFNNKKRKIALTTPTHQSLGVLIDKLKMTGVEDLPSSTVHSFLNLKMKINFKTGAQTFEPDDYQKDKKKYDIMVVDESSMISEQMFETVKGVLDKRAKLILFVGDFYQLEPVDGDPNKVTDVAWSYELTDIQRQVADSDIIKEATFIRESLESKKFEPLSSLFGIADSDEIKVYGDKNDFMDAYFSDTNHKMITAFTNNNVDNYNTVARLHTYGPDACAYVPGEKLIFQNSLYDDDVQVHMNGDVVTIKEVELKLDDDIKCWVWHIKTTDVTKFKIIDKGSLSNYEFYLNQYKQSAIGTQDYKVKRTAWKEFYKLKGEYAEIKYAFSGTIHKMQGTTVETVYFDLKELVGFDRGNNRESLYRLMYVAITRPSKKLVILI